jgi:hypothetical protein
MKELERECSVLLADYRPAELTPPLEAWNSKEPGMSVNSSRSDDAEISVSAAGIQLTDRAVQNGLNMNYENGHTGFKYLIETMGPGVGVIDFDNDGWPDLYCPQGGTLGDGPRLAPLPDQIFRNQGGYRFNDVTPASGIREYGYSQGLAVGDINNDGFDDIVVANVGRNTMLLNCGDGTFSEVTDNNRLRPASHGHRPARRTNSMKIWGTVRSEMSRRALRSVQVVERDWGLWWLNWTTT